MSTGRSFRSLSSCCCLPELRVLLAGVGQAARHTEDHAGPGSSMTI